MSGDSGAKITVDADTRSVEAGAQKVQRGFKQAAHEVHGIGGQLEHVGKHLAGHILGVRALVQLLEHAGEAMKEYQKSLAEASKTAGEGTMSRAQSAGRLGLTGDFAKSLTAPSGAFTRKEGDSFLGQLASLSNGRGGGPTKQDVARAFNLRRSGVFESSEIIDAVKNGRLNELEGQVGKRTADQGPELQEELSTRAEVNQLDDATEEDKAAHGAKYRLASARIAARDARNPIGGAATSVLKSIPIIGAAVDIADNAHVAASLDRIANNTDSKPKLAPGGTE